jgi:hypothetical protein
MMRVAIRSAIVVLALVLVVASAGTVLCEMECAAGGHTDAAAAIGAGASGVTTSHCDGEQMDSGRHEMPMPDGSSGGNRKHSGAHSHLRIVATAGAEVQISPALILSDFAVTPVSFGSAIPGSVAGNFWNNNSSPPIKSPSVFSTGVLRI